MIIVFFTGKIKVAGVRPRDRQLKKEKWLWVNSTAG